MIEVETVPRFHLSQRDAVEWLRALPAESVDCLITDPAYESLEKHRAVGTTTRLKNSKASSNKWFQIFENARFPELFEAAHRVLKKDTHFYLFCDPETAFVAKPIGEQAGFKFWKPLVWDKCLAPDTPVWTTRGVVELGDVCEGDEVAVPEGGFARVRATRRTTAPVVRLQLSDGSTLVASREHRFVLADGRQVEASELDVGAELLSRPVRARTERALDLGSAKLGIRAKRQGDEQELIDISIDHPDELFLLGNGVVTHNCKIGMGYHYRARYEMILFFEKGKRKLNDLGVPDIIEVPRIYRGYPAEKPAEVSEVLITQSTEEGEVVGDPFMGSGSAGVAAMRHGRRFWGNDLCEEALQVAGERLRQEGGEPTDDPFDAANAEGADASQLGLELEG